MDFPAIREETHKGKKYKVNSRHAEVYINDQLNTVNQKIYDSHWIILFVYFDVLLN
jgi:hypothetical protein